MADFEGDLVGKISNDLTLNSGTRTELGASFATSGEDYDRVRPRYPAKAIAAVSEFAGLQPGDRILEIGCGSGIGTRALVAAGLEVDALDPSEPMLAVAEDNLAVLNEVARRNTGHQAVRFVKAGLEDLDVTEIAPYPAVTSFQAIHWVDPAERWAKPAQVLQPGGVMAFMSNFPDAALISEYGPDFPDESIEGPDRVRETRVRYLYEDFCPKFPSADWGSLDRMTEDMQASELFEEPSTRILFHEQTYTREEYLEWQQSLSWVKALDEVKKAEFLGEVERVMGDQDQVNMPWQTWVVMAHKKAE